MSDNIKELREGNHMAFEQLFDNCYGPLCRYAYSILRNMDDAEDVVQKTFCKLWDQREALNIHSSMNSYLYRIVHNDSINMIQQRIVHQEHHLNYVSSMDEIGENSSSEHIESSELQEAIDRALEALPPQCRKVFEMSRFEQLPYSKIAAELNISTNTVENHISKALRLLRANLKDYISCFLILQILKQL